MGYKICLLMSFRRLNLQLQRQTAQNNTTKTNKTTTNNKTRFQLFLQVSKYTYKTIKIVFVPSIDRPKYPTILLRGFWHQRKLNADFR